MSLLHDLLTAWELPLNQQAQLREVSSGCSNNTQHLLCLSQVGISQNLPNVQASTFDVDKRENLTWTSEPRPFDVPQKVTDLAPWSNSLNHIEYMYTLDLPRPASNSYHQEYCIFRFLGSGNPTLNLCHCHLLLLGGVDPKYTTGPTWRIIPVQLGSGWQTMVSKFPNWGYSPSKWLKWLLARGC